MSKKNTRPRTRQQRKKKKRLKILLILEILFLLAVVLFGVYYFFYSKLDHDKGGMDDVVINEFNDPNMKDYQNIALFGMDSQVNDLEDSSRSDALMVLSIHKKTKNMKLISVYRDTYVNIDNHGLDKINHAYAFGNAQLAVSTLNQNLDLNIDDYVTVNFKALANAVDALGGIEIDVKSYELKNLNNYIGNMNKINGGNSPKIKNPGLQTLDGNQAVAYTRIRYSGNGDFERTERQRRVFTELLKKSKKSNPVALVKLVNIMFPQIKTSLNPFEVLGLAKDIGSYDLVEQGAFPTKQDGRRIGGIYYGVPVTLKSNVIELHKTMFGTEDYVPSNTVIEISDRIASK